MSGGEADPPSQERFERVRAVFLAAARLPDRERDALIEREAGGDDALAAEVRALLAHDGQDEAFIARPALAAAESLAGTPWRIGPYVIRAKIGEGGMGSVFEAVQESPRRVVALKVLHPSISTDSTRRRFERETRLLARLHHPGIAQIFEAGEAETDLGRQPYFAMERVDGLPITEHASRNGLGTPERLRLFARVCDAVQHAHDRGVVHRDLKPANVLVDASGQPKVLDFGVARLLERDVERFTSALTGEDLILGTVPYLAPEQAAGHAREIDGRADVYSLGVILYELMTGDLPFDVRARPAAEALRIVLDRDPTPPAARSRALRGDVETIIGKAMEKDRERRYATPSALATDVRRHLRSEPIEARPPSAFYRARKFAGRNRALVAGGLATILALAAGGAVATGFAVAERKARWLADWNAYRSGVLLAESALAAGEVAAARSALEGAPERHRAFEWGHLWRSLEGGVLAFEAAEEPRAVNALAFSEDGLRLWIATAGGGLRAVELDDVGDVARAAGAEELAGASITALGPRAELHLTAGATGAGAADQRTSLRRTGAPDALVAELGPSGGTLESAAISPRGDRVAGWTDQTSFALFDTSSADARCVGTWRGDRHERAHAVFSADGTLLAFGSGDGSVRVLDAASGAERAFFRAPERISGLAFSPDGARLAVGYGLVWVSPESGVSIHDAGSGTRVTSLAFEAGPVDALAFSPDGVHLAIGARAGVVHVVDAATGALAAVHRSRGASVGALAFSPDGTFLAAGTRDGAVAVFAVTLDADESCVLRGHEWYVYGCAFSPDGRIVASGAWDSTVRLWDAASGIELAALAEPSYSKRVAFAPDGDLLLSVAHQGSYGVREARTGREIARWREEGEIHDGTFSHDGASLVVATGAPGRTLFTRDARTGEIGATLDEPLHLLLRLAVAPDGRSVFAAALDGSVRRHALPSLALERASPPGKILPYSIACSLDGERIVVARHDGAVEVLDAATLDVEWARLLPGGEAFVARFSPDGARIAAGSRDGRLRLIDARTGEVVASLRGHADYVHDLAWSPDGSAVVTASGDGTLRLWDTEPVGPRIRARLDAERVQDAAAERAQALYAELGDAATVVERIESDSSLSPGARAATLRAALRQRP